MPERNALPTSIEVLHGPAPGRGALCYYEDAGFHQAHLAAIVRDRLAPLVDVFSLSDEELAALLGRAVDLPMRGPDAVGRGRLCRLVPARLVLHTGHWALAVGPRPTASCRPWPGGGAGHDPLPAAGTDAGHPA